MNEVMLAEQMGFVADESLRRTSWFVVATIARSNRELSVLRVPWSFERKIQHCVAQLSFLWVDSTYTFGPFQNADHADPGIREHRIDKARNE